jgi:hypothetical protein
LIVMRSRLTAKSASPTTSHGCVTIGVGAVCAASSRFMPPTVSMSNRGVQVDGARLGLERKAAGPDLVVAAPAAGRDRESDRGGE